MAEVQARAGWNGKILPGSLQRRWAAEQAREAREEAQAARVREQFSEQRRSDAIAASLASAQDRGQEIDMRTALRHGVRRTRQEALRWTSALGDLQDAQQEAARRKRFRESELREASDWSADTSAPGEIDVSELLRNGARGTARRRTLSTTLSLGRHRYKRVARASCNGTRP